MNEQVFTKPRIISDDLPSKTNISIKLDYNEEGEVMSVKRLVNGKWQETIYPGVTPEELEEVLEDYYTKEDIGEIIDQLHQFQAVVVDELPETGEPNIIYLVPSTDSKTKNVKDEWMYVENDWEKVGSTKVDITGKADKVANATSGNFAGLDSNGNLTDSGKKAGDFATAAQGAKADTALQSFTETDPTVPAWAKASSKPTYAIAEITGLSDALAALAQEDEDNSYVISSHINAIYDLITALTTRVATLENASNNNAE